MNNKPHGLGAGIHGWHLDQINATLKRIEIIAAFIALLLLCYGVVSYL